MTNVTPLEARENRWNKKCSLAKTMQLNIISITLNVPNQVKTEEKFIELHKNICEKFINMLKTENIAVSHKEYEVTSDGAYMLLAIDYDSTELKKITIKFEEQKKAYRLADIDVMDKNETVIGRQELGLPPRKCYICSDDAKLCIVGKKHGLSEVLEAVYNLCESMEDKLKHITDCALKGILYEVCAYPKPGLVTSNDSGSHSDMDIYTFVDSSLAIAPYFYKLAKIGAESKDLSNDEIMQKVRYCGIEAEKAMFKATNGINTHKGMIFAMGIVCTCGGICIAEKENITAKAIANHSKKLLFGVTEKELASLKNLTEEELQNRKLSHGEKLYLEYGVTGARGEAEQGFPICIEVGLPVLKQGVANNLTMNDALVDTLISIMATAEDTNILSRGGQKGLSFVNNRARDIIKLGGMSSRDGRDAIIFFDSELKTLNLSPGGGADMLALTVAIMFMENSTCKNENIRVQ